MTKNGCILLSDIQQRTACFVQKILKAQTKPLVSDVSSRADNYKLYKNKARKKIVPVTGAANATTCLTLFTSLKNNSKM